MRHVLLGALVCLTLVAGLGLYWYFQNPPAARPGANKEHVMKTDDEWQEILTAEQYRVARKKGTERVLSPANIATTTMTAFSLCACCGQPLFDSKTKYESGSGWPSFWQQPVDAEKTWALGMDDSKRCS